MRFVLSGPDLTHLPGLWLGSIDFGGIPRRDSSHWSADSILRAAYPDVTVVCYCQKAIAERGHLCLMCDFPLSKTTSRSTLGPWASQLDYGSYVLSIDH
ncbi:hypothetical protein ACLOJK_006281 [Asimina triloba]